MAAEARIDIKVGGADQLPLIRREVAEVDAVLRKVAAKKYQLKIETAGTEIAAQKLAYLTSSAAKFDAQLKESEAAAKRFANSLQSQMQAEQDMLKAREGLASSMNDYDRAIQNAEAAGKAFSQQLQQQIREQQEIKRINDEIAKSEEKKAEQHARAAREMDKLAASIEKENQAAQQTQEVVNNTRDGFNALSVAMGTLVSHAVMRLVRMVRQAFREALTEMKNVDTELTNISKVSGKTGDELERIGDAAYETATKYGVAASEYLQAVYAMQKAGMGDNSEAMGELAVKTMLVGDTTQDVATKFLLATNAAWKLEGNMERLGQIVDEADYINNNYATSLDKLAAGMPIVASVAENAGMSAEETMAALGTITAATQESGTKAATALRALILNISKETGKFITEEGEEFEVTAESVKTVQGLLEKYAKTEVEAAKASGELLDPMTAIRALFKGMAEDDLNDVELFNLLSGMGGKLRTNQLTALVKNFESLYTDMMGNIANAAGTADSEIDLMMNSWEKKTQVLKNTWTQLVADVIDTGLVKGGLEGLTEIIGKADELVEILKDPFYGSESITKGIEDLKKEYDGLLQKMLTGDLTKEEKARLDVLREQLEVMRLQQKVEEESAAKKLQDELTKQYYDSMGRPMQGPITSADTEAAFNIRKAASDLTFGGNIADYQEALRGINKTFDDYYTKVVRVRDAGEKLTEAQQQFITDYETIRDVANASNLSLGESAEGYREIVDSQGNVIAKVQDASVALEEQKELLEQGITPAQKEFTDSLTYLGDVLSPISEFFKNWVNDYAESIGGTVGDAEALDAAIEAGFDNAASGAENLTDQEDNAADAGDDIATAAGSIDFSGAAASAGALAGELSTAERYARGLSMLGGFGFASGTSGAPGGPALVNELGPELISENGKAYIANGGRPGIVNLSRGAVVLNATETKIALTNKGKKGKSISAFGDGTNVLGVTSSKKPFNFGLEGPGRTVTPPIGVYKNPNDPLDFRVVVPTGSKSTITSTLRSEITSTLRNAGKKGGSEGGGASGPTAKSVEELAKETKDILSNIEKQAKLADNRKQYDKEVSLWEKGQKEIDKMVAQYKKAGYKETDDEVLDLLNKRFDYEKKKDAASKKTIEEAASELKDKLTNLDKQAKLADTNGDYEKEVRFYETAQEAIKEMVEKYRAAGYADDSDEILDLLQKNVDYGEKQVKIYKDRWNDLIDALDADTEAQEAANALAEKEQALADAREALANASKQRTVRTYNAATGQWEWVADQSKVKSAQDTLTKAEENYSKEVKDQAIKELERLRDTMADLNDVILGPALSAIMSQAESSDTFQNFARALNGVYGVGSFLASTEGSSKVLSTADSHDTIYTFGNVTLTEEEASSMSVAQLAQRLQVLKIS